MGETYDEMLAIQMGESDCETFLDGNGERQTSSGGPDRIGDPPKKKLKSKPPTSEEIATYEEF